MARFNLKLQCTNSFNPVKATLTLPVPPLAVTAESGHLRASACAQYLRATLVHGHLLEPAQEADENFQHGAKCILCLTSTLEVD